MSQRKLIKNILNNHPAERCGFWTGNPQPETIATYNAKLGTSDLEEIQNFIGDDIRWITPHHFKSTYRHPEGKVLLPWKEANPMGLANGPLSYLDTIEKVNAYDWPRTKYLDLTETIEQLKGAGDHFRLSGFWSPFFHDLSFMFGTEDLLIKMYTNPDVVHAVLGNLCSFYLEANEILYNNASDNIDAHFFGNDFGSQNDLLISPDLFEEFYLPWIKKFADQAHKYGYHSILHSCGSIYRIIDHLVDAGIDCIHPVQALATNMDADYLAANFKGKIKFMGGIDTQQLLPYGSEEDVRKGTQRVIDLLGPGLIVSPSHESLMPLVPIENVIAMAQTAKRIG
jgi:uroporphyrinogen decarboxylase